MKIILKKSSIGRSMIIRLEAVKRIRKKKRRTAKQRAATRRLIAFNKRRRN